MDVRSHNRVAWDKAVEDKSEWSIPVTPEVTEAARRGEWHIILTPTIPVPLRGFLTTYMASMCSAWLQAAGSRDRCGRCRRHSDRLR